MAPSHLPLGPSSALSQLFHIKDPFPLMDDLMLRYSDPMTCPLLGQAPMVLTWSPEGVRAVQAAPRDAFDPGTPDALAAIVGTGSLFLQRGEQHKRSRKLLSPPFQGDSVKDYAGIVELATRRWLAKRPVGASFSFLELAQGITLDVIIEAVFGERDEERVARLHHEILQVVGAFHPLVATFKALQKDFFGWGPWAKLQARTRELRASIQALIEEKRKVPGRDMLSLLLETRDEHGKPLDDAEIYDQLLTFVVAGHETTATSLSWAMYELHRNPDTLRRLMDELHTHRGKDPLELDRSIYLDAVVSETLRRHPPVPIVARKCAREFELSGYLLPAGQTLGMAVYMAHHDERYHQRPKEFVPERFVDADPAPFILPFGGGVRRCLGAAFAMTELRVALATCLLGAGFELREPRPVRSVFRVGTFGPETGIRVHRSS